MATNPTSNIYHLLREEEPSKPEKKTQAKKTAPTTAVTGGTKVEKKLTQTTGTPHNSGSLPEKKNQRSGGRGGDHGSRVHKLEKQEKQGDAPRGKRIFEKRSGTGQRRNDTKKGGSGKGNWDNPKNKADVEAEANPEQEKVEKTTEEVVVPAEPEEKTRSLDEFMATQKQGKKEIQTLLGSTEKATRSLDGFSDNEKAKLQTVVHKPAQLQLSTGKASISSGTAADTVLPTVPGFNFVSQPISTGSGGRGGFGGRGGSRGGRGGSRGGRGGSRGGRGGSRGGNNSTGRTDNGEKKTSGGKGKGGKTSFNADLKVDFPPL